MLHASASRRFQVMARGVRQQVVRRRACCESDGEHGVYRKTDDTVEPCANDRENVGCVAEKSAGSSKEACGSTHHGSRGPVENNQWTEFDNSWDLMSRRTNWVDSWRYENICDNITGKRLSPEAVRIARREEVEFMDKLAVLKEVPVEQSWSETNAKPIEIKWIYTNKGDGDRVESMSRLVAIELEVHQVKMGIFRDNVFSATPPLEFRATLDELECWLRASKPGHWHQQSSLPFSIQKTCVCGFAIAERERSRCCGLVTQEHVRNTKRDGESRSDRHGHTDQHGIRDWKIQSFVCTDHAGNGIRLFLPRWPARDTGSWNTSYSCLRKNWTKHWSGKSVECSVEMKVTYLEKITWLNLIVRYGQTMNGWPFSEWKADPRHVEISTETIGLKRCRRQQDTEFTRHQEKHGWSHRDRFESWSGQDIPKRVHETSTTWLRTRGTSFCSREDGEVDVSDKHHGVEKGKEMRSVLVGQADNVTEFRDATSSWHNHVESRFWSCRVLEDKKIHNMRRSQSRKACDQDSVDDTNDDRICQTESQNSARLCVAQSQPWAWRARPDDYGHEVNIALETDSLSGRDMSLWLIVGKVRHVDIQWWRLHGVFQKREAVIWKILRTQQLWSRLHHEIHGQKENPRHRATYGLPLHEGHFAVCSQSSARWLESGGPGQAENEEHQNRRKTRKHSSNSADSEIQRELRKRGIGHEWNTMKTASGSSSSS